MKTKCPQLMTGKFSRLFVFVYGFFLIFIKFVMMISSMYIMHSYFLLLPLLLTDPFHTAMPFCFVLGPSDLTQCSLCDHRFGTVH